MSPRETFPCPACGAVVVLGAVSCRACGADERTGWAQDDPEETAQELDLPRAQTDEEYGDFLADEFGAERPARRRWSAQAVLLVLVLAVALGFALSLLR